MGILSFGAIGVFAETFLIDNIRAFIIGETNNAKTEISGDNTADSEVVNLEYALGAKFEEFFSTPTTIE